MSSLELVRWALYTDLALLFGVPAAAFLVQAEANLWGLRRVLWVLASMAVLLSAAGFLLLVAQMAGVSIGEIDRELVAELLTGSALGWAIIARLAALATTLACLSWSRCKLRWLWLPSAISVATLAWSGHAAASEGSLGLVRLLSDVAHLIAASIWLGALVLFLIMLFTRRDAVDTAGALARFSGIGTVLVLLLFVTGIGNLTFLVAPEQWAAVSSGPYGRLLMVKLALFLAMLILASTNRFWLVPQLTQPAKGASQNVFRGLRISVAAEFLIGWAVLLIVSHLGQLDPIAF